MAGRRPLVAFYAPMKAPDHPVPSGDRTVARLYVAALKKAGFDVEIASDFRIFDGQGSAENQRILRAGAAAEVRRLSAQYQNPDSRRPDLWFSYHVYHKSPDLIGPEICRNFGISYVISEASRAKKHSAGPWRDFFGQADKAILAAERLFVATQKDWPGLLEVKALESLIKTPPFIDDAGWPIPMANKQNGTRKPVQLLTVAMMRGGDKLHSFKLLAQSLESLPQGNWHLTIVGDGEARGEVEALFARFGDKIHFSGQVNDRTLMAQHYDNADVFVWPAVNEAYGMALLEAGLMGLPVVAGDEGGVFEVVRDGTTGFLANKRDVRDFSVKLGLLLDDPALRLRMGAAARRFVREERSLASAAQTLADTLKPLIEKTYS